MTRAHPDQDHHRPRLDLYATLPWAGVTLNILAAVVLWQPQVGAVTRPPGAPITALPWLATGVQLLAAVQIAGLLAILALLLGWRVALRLRARRTTATR